MYSIEALDRSGRRWMLMMPYLVVSFSILGSGVRSGSVFIPVVCVDCEYSSIWVLCQLRHFRLGPFCFDYFYY